MTVYYLKLRLLTDATFGRGDGIAGLVDVEVEHDQYGIPYLRGRTLKGLWREECENLIAALSLHDYQRATQLKDGCDRVFGRGGSDLHATGVIHVGDARLPETVQSAVMRANLTPHDILTSLTTIRRQTAIDAEGVAKDHSLRAMRAILRHTTFISPISSRHELDRHELAILVAGCYALRHVGTGRNRGRGDVTCRLYNAQGHELDSDLLTTFTGGRA